MGYAEIESMVLKAFNDSGMDTGENGLNTKKMSFILDKFCDEYSIENLNVFCEIDGVITVEFKCCVLDFYLEYMKMLKDSLNDMIFVSFGNESDEYITVHAEIKVGEQK